MHWFYNESALRERLDARWARRGRFWLVSQLLTFLTTPNGRLRAKLDSARAELGLAGGAYLGLHVRAGDACRDRGDCRGLKEAMPAVTRMVQAYGFGTVFLATPDPAVLAEVGNYSNVTFRARPPTDAVDIMKARNFTYGGGHSNYSSRCTASARTSRIASARTSRTASARTSRTASARTSRTASLPARPSPLQADRRRDRGGRGRRGPRV
eukprot:4319661-Prymnesium_polylepis.1